MNEIGYDDLCRMILGAVDQICLHSDELSLLDAEVGDGDHGVTMRRAMEKAAAVISAHSGQDVSSLLDEIGWALMSIDGGATGPLFGSLFLGMSEASAGKSTLDLKDFAGLFAGGLASLQQQSKARLGDKTLMDALIPAVEALQAQSAQSQDILAALRAGALAARAGSNATANLVAHFGRAKYQGERTLGKLDPGSVSMAYFFEGLLAGLEKQISTPGTPI